MDPGSKNFAWAFRKEGKLITAGWLKAMPTVYEDEEFINHYLELLTKLKPDFVILERFMVRDRGQSVLAEIINQMIGRICVLSRAFGRDVLQVTAAQWKVYMEKNKGKDSTGLFPELPSIHQQDAAAMALYADEYWITETVKRAAKS
jgi:hypothetical protein